MLSIWLAGSLALGSSTAAVADLLPGPFRIYVATDNRFAAKPPVDQPQAEPTRDPRDRTDKLHDFVTEYGLNPMVIVLTRAEPNADGAAAQIARGLTDLYADRTLGGTSLSAFVAFLVLEDEFAFDRVRTADGGFVRDEKLKAVRDVAAAVSAPRVPFGLAARTSTQATDWGFTDDLETVVLIVNKLGVVERYPFGPGEFSEANLKTILDVARGVARQ